MIYHVLELGNLYQVGNLPFELALLDLLYSIPTVQYSTLFLLLVLVQ